MRRAGGVDRRRRAAAAPRDLPEIVEGIIARKKFVYRLHQRAADGEEARPVQAEPLFHLVGPSRRRPRDARPVGLPGGRLRQARSRRSQRPRRAASASTSTARCSTTPSPSASPTFFDTVTALGIDGITVSPGYAYERAPDQEHFLNRTRTKQLFRDIFRRGKDAQGWSFNQSSLFLDFLAGNQTYHCTPWGNPTRNCVRLAAALLPARRRLRQDLQGADGGDRLGRLRHRQLREMRRLHGA